MFIFYVCILYMAGGVFPKQKFVLNIKCIIFSIICMALFLYKPNIQSNFMLAITLFIIFVIAYVAMAWYDWAFDCSLLPLKRGKKSFTGMFKPPPHDEEKQVGGKKTKQDISLEKYLIYVSHIVLFAPLLLYVAYKKGKSASFVFPLLAALAVMTIFYHGGALIFSTKQDTKKSTEIK